jgi:hypothetical protein
MQSAMIHKEYGTVQLDWLRDVISEMELATDMIRSILNDGLKCGTTVNSGNIQSESQDLGLKYQMIHEAIAKADIEI